MDYTMQALKRKFIEEKSNLKKAALIFLLSKLYFTDETAAHLKLRIINEEWLVFRQYIKDIKNDLEYTNICLMFYQLYTESFFRFTLKIKILDFGTEENLRENFDDISCESTQFWNTVENEIKRLEHVTMNEIKQLCEIRDEIIQPFDSVLPEKISIDEILEEFSAFKLNIDRLKQTDLSISRKEVLQVCRDYMKKTTAGRINSKNLANLTDDEIDFEALNSVSIRTNKKKKSVNAQKSVKSKPSSSKRKPRNVSIATTSESEQESIKTAV